MNTTLKLLRWIGQPERAGLSTPTDQTTNGSAHQRIDTLGSYGRGS